MTTKINYSVYGFGSSVVLIHGWGMDSSVWHAIARELAKEFQVILFDLPGYGANLGLSDNHELAKIGEMIRSIIPQRSIVIGWSMGGLIAMWLAINYPRLVSRLILISSTPRFIEGNNWPGVAMSVFTAFKEGLAKDFARTMLRFVALQVGTKKNQATCEELKFLRNIVSSQDKYSKDILLCGLEILLNTDLRAQVAKIKSPVLWLFGEEDPLVPAKLGQCLEAYMSHVQVKIFPGVSHAPFIFCRDHFLQEVTKFIYARSI